MAQHSKQISRQSDEAQQFSSIPQSSTAWHASSVHAAWPAASTQQQHAVTSQQAAPPTPHAKHSPSAENMDSSSQNRQASRQWTQQSVETVAADRFKSGKPKWVWKCWISIRIKEKDSVSFWKIQKSYSVVIFIIFCFLLWLLITFYHYRDKIFNLLNYLSYYSLIKYL